MLKKQDVVVFDFDGTLSAKDAGVEFGKYCFRNSLRPWLFLPLALVATVARKFNLSGIWWRNNINRYQDADTVKKFAPDFIKQHKMERFGWSADQVAAERAAGRKVLLISAGPNFLIPELVKDIKFDAVICTQRDPEKPWRIKSLCWGEHKVAAMDEWAKKNKIIPNLVRSYSDSKTDLPIMRVASEQVWINPKTGMRKD